MYVHSVNDDHPFKSELHVTSQVLIVGLVNPVKPQEGGGGILSLRYLV
jgi:hypothetical protein